MLRMVTHCDNLQLIGRAYRYARLREESQVGASITMDNPRIHGALRPRVREQILVCFPSSRARVDIHSTGHGERRWNPCARLRIDTCMYSIGLRIKEPSSHMAPKRNPYHSLSFSFPFDFPFLRRSLFLSISLSASLSFKLSRTPLYPYPPRTLQFSNGFVLADYVS